MLALITTLVLACNGGGTAVKRDVQTIEGNTSVNGSYNYGQGQYSGQGNYSGTVTSRHDRAYGDQVDVEISDDGSRIRLPRVTLPPIHGGNGGWFVLKDLAITDRAIDAKAGVNFVNMPKVHIDRVTGTISIYGMNGNYTGQCAAIDTEAKPQF